MCCAYFLNIFAMYLLDCIWWMSLHVKILDQISFGAERIFIWWLPCLLILWWCWFWCCFAGIQIPKYVDTVTPQYKPKFDALVSTNIILRFLLHHWLLFSCFFRTFLGLKDLLLVSSLLPFCLQFLQETEKMIFLFMILKFWNINSDV